MRFNMYFSALAFILLCHQFGVCAGHPHQRSGHEHTRRGALEPFRRNRLHPREVSIQRRDGSLQDLQTEVTFFSSWIATWLASPNVTTFPSAVSAVEPQIQQHQSFLQSWIDTAATNASSYNVQQLQIELNAFNSWIVEWFSLGDSTTLEAALALLQQEVQDYLSWLTAWLTVAGFGIVTTPTIGTSQATAMSVMSSTAIAVNTTMSTSYALASTTPIQTSSPIPSLQPSQTAATFNPTATDNLAVYFGQSDMTSTVPLNEICADENINIIVIGFVTSFFSSNGTGYLTVNFGAAGGYMNSAMAAAGATGLLEADVLAANITACQQAGKIVLLSIGGAVSTVEFANDTQAEYIATELWNLFGAGNGTAADLRPFGSVVLDGFDIDNESHNPTGYVALATSLRNLYATDTSKAYYLSGAPQCPIPDASIPLAAMLQMDFVWVQFYNNPSCNVGSSGFISSIQAWSSQLNNGTKPLLFLGAEAETGDGSSYIPIADLQGNITSVKALNLPNFGGVNLWDGSQAVANGNFQDGVKSALTG